MGLSVGSIAQLAIQKEAFGGEKTGNALLRIDKKEKWIKDYVERETAVARKGVQDAETAMMQELNDMTTAENVGATTGKPEITFEEMLNAIGDSLSDLACSYEEQDGEDEEYDEDDTELGKLSDDDEPGWVMGTISNTVEHCLESFRQKQMKLDELTQPDWGDAANYFRERDMKYRTTELMVLAVFKPQIDTTAATPSPTTFGEQMQTLHMVRGKSPMTVVTSRPGSSQMRLGSENPQSHQYIQVFSPDAATDSMPIQDAKPVEPVSFYPCMKHAKLIPIQKSDTDEDMVTAPASPEV